MKIKSKLVAFLAIFALSALSAGAALSFTNSVPNNVNAGLGLYFNFGVTNLPPATRYSAVFYAYGSENDVPYVEGYGTALKTNGAGYISFSVDSGEFVYFKPNLYEVKACLTEPTDPYRLVKREDGSTICEEFEVTYY